MTKKIVSVRKTQTTTELVEKEFPVYVQYGDIHDGGGGYDVVTRISVDGAAVTIKRSYHRNETAFEVSVDQNYQFYESENIEDATAQDFDSLVADMKAFLLKAEVLEATVKV